MKIFLQSILIFFSVLQAMSLTVYSQMVPLRVEPPSWWTNMTDPTVQLLVYGQNISQATVIIDKPGIFIKEVRQTENPDYLFIDLDIEKSARTGVYQFVFEYQREIMATYDFELEARNQGSRERQGFGNHDVIYLVMPDRFANGDPDNDAIPGMLEGADRENPDGRHGGDLRGITERLGYISNLGATAIWLNPVLENNNPEYSYHGYAITDFYQVDARFGGNQAYLEFVEAAHDQGLKVIMDMVFNHCSLYHWWMQSLPASDWIHWYPEFTRSNFRSETIMDPYASEFDRKRMLTGWFDKHMPDLAQENEYLANYLIQNSIWWIEQAGLDGIRMDTYPYSDKDFMVNWIRRIRMEYPNFSVVGETWLQKESHTAYFQDEARNKDGYDSDLPIVTDFPMHFALKEAFNEQDGWTSGLARLYYVLSQDFLYPEPMNTVIFADNHDLTRYYTSLHENLDRWKMGMAFLLTTRGIPMVYYGTEFLMTGEESAGHGYIRQDFPIWEKEQLDNWTVGQLDTVQQDAFKYLQQLLSWRKSSKVIHHGMLKQFVPKDGIYVYFRYDETQTVMVILNNNEEQKSFDWGRYGEATEGFVKAKNVIDGIEIPVGQKFSLKPKSAGIYELIGLE